MATTLYASKAQDEYFNLLGDPYSPTSHTFIDLFAYRKKGGIKFNTNDLIMIGPEHSPYVSANSITTVGIYIANKFLFEDFKVFGYINKPLTGKTIGKIDDAIAAALLAGDITQQQVCDYIDRCQYIFGGTLSHIINTSLSNTLLSLPKSAAKLLKEELANNAEGLAANDPQVSSKIEKTVVTEALSEMRKKNDPAMALFDSDCGIDPYNNYRTMFVMKGAIVDNTLESPTGYKIVTSNYNDGVSKEDMPIIADSLITSAYSKGVATQDAGTSAKRLNAVFQRVRLQDRGSDCKSTKTNRINITDSNRDNYMYRNIIDGGKIVMLTPDNIGSYIGKTVNMRTPLYCKAADPEYCSCCAGDRPYRIGIKNTGLTFNIIAGSTLNAMMKKFHDISVKIYTITENDILKYKDINNM